MEGLTARQEQVLEFIRESIRVQRLSADGARDLRRPRAVVAVHGARASRQPRAARAHQARSHQAARPRRGARPAAAAAAAAGRPRRRRRAHPRRGEHRRARRRARLPAPRRRRLRAARPGRLHGRRRHLQRRLHRRPPAGRRPTTATSSSRWCGDEATTKRFYREGRHGPPAARERALRADHRRRRRGPARRHRSWGCFAAYEYRASRHSRVPDARRRRRRRPRRRPRRARRRLPVVRRRVGRGRRGRSVERRVVTPLRVMRQRARGRRPAQLRELPRERAAGRRRSRPRSVAAARAPRRRRRSAARRRASPGLVRFAVFVLIVFVAVWAGVRVAHAGDDAQPVHGRRATRCRPATRCGASPRAHYGDDVDLRQAVYDIRAGQHGCSGARCSRATRSCCRTRESRAGAERGGCYEPALALEGQVERQRQRRASAPGRPGSPRPQCSSGMCVKFMP